MKKLLIIIILAFLVPQIVSAACEEVYASREYLCLIERADPCECASDRKNPDGSCWYTHSPERIERRAYIQDGYSCRACTLNRSPIWVHNDGNGWEDGRCGTTLTPQPTNYQYTILLTNLIGRIKARTFNLLLRESAEAHANYMAETNNFSHWGFPKWVEDIGYEYSHTGEIIARNNGEPENIINDWTNSPSHNAIIIGEDTEFGCWYTRPYAVCHFATPRGIPLLPDPIPTPESESPLQCNLSEIRTILEQIQALITQLLTLL